MASDFDNRRGGSRGGYRSGGGSRGSYDDPYADPYGEDPYADEASGGYGSRQGRAGADGRWSAPRGRGGSRRGRRTELDLLHSDLSREPISRHAVLAVGLGLCSLAAVGSLADYQLINRDTYLEEADSRRLLSQTLYAKRGTIYDRNGTVLTSSIECKNVYLNPSLIEDGQADDIAAALVEVLGIDEETAEDLVGRDGTFVYVKRRVDNEDAEALDEYGFSAIQYEETTKRIYPNGSLASQVLGVVSVDGEGSCGLEQYYNDILTGTDGSIVRERAADGTYVAGGAYQKVPAEDGTDLVLTIDATIQQAAEDACKQAVEDTDSERGSIFVTDPTTGEILAACSYPTYDPTDLSDVEYADMVLRGVVDSYEPGSVFKTFVCGAAINEGLVTPSTSFYVPATIQVGDDYVSDSDDRGSAMTMTVREILRRSSNVGMVMVGRQLGADLMDEYVKAYGFGSSCGIDYPDESAGIVKDRDEYDGATLGSMSFGQAISVPPVQMLRAMHGIANGGVMTTPHFLLSQEGEEVDWSEGDTQVISADAAGDVADMMLTVVEEGTGAAAAIDGYEISGKTGTAQIASTAGYEESLYMSSFIGFANTTDPRALCYVTLSGTASSSSAALAPFKSVMETAIAVLDVPSTG